MTELNIVSGHSVLAKTAHNRQQIVKIAISLGLCDNRTNLVQAANALEDLVIKALMDIESLQAEIKALKGETSMTDKLNNVDETGNRIRIKTNGQHIDMHVHSAKLDVIIDKLDYHTWLDKAAVIQLRDWLSKLLQDEEA